VINPEDVPDVSVQKRVRGPATVQVGGTVSFDLIVRVESGLAGIKNVRLVDTLPSGLKFVSVTSPQAGKQGAATCEGCAAGTFLHAMR
jgi:uncharacterized repeat protein (TIGR01451 family)